MNISKYFASIILLALFLVGNISVFPNNKVSYIKKDFGSDEYRILDLVNRERERRGQTPLRWNSRLAELARSYSQKMAKDRFFSHFDRDGKNVEDRAYSKKIKNWRLIGENLFMGQGFDRMPEVAVRGWMKSPTHRDNILESRFNETGIGIAESRDGMIYVTQVFMQY